MVAFDFAASFDLQDTSHRRGYLLQQTARLAEALDRLPFRGLGTGGVSAGRTSVLRTVDDSLRVGRGFSASAAGGSPSGSRTTCSIHQDTRDLRAGLGEDLYRGGVLRPGRSPSAPKRRTRPTVRDLGRRPG